MSVSSVIGSGSRNGRCTFCREPRWRHTDTHIQSYFAVVLFWRYSSNTRCELNICYSIWYFQPLASVFFARPTFENCVPCRHAVPVFALSCSFSLQYKTHAACCYVDAAPVSLAAFLCLQSEVFFLRPNTKDLAMSTLHRFLNLVTVFKRLQLHAVWLSFVQTTNMWICVYSYTRK